MRNVFLAASKKLELDGVFLKSFILAHENFQRLLVI